MQVVYIDTVQNIIYYKGDGIITPPPGWSASPLFRLTVPQKMAVGLRILCWETMKEHRLQAIKLIMKNTASGLKETKDAVDWVLGLNNHLWDFVEETYQQS